MNAFKSFINRNESSVSSEVVRTNNPFFRLRNKFAGQNKNLSEYEKFELINKPKPTLLARVLPKRKNDFELRRFQTHMMAPYVNDNFSMRIFTHQTLTLAILTSALLTGYCYARLTSDEHCRRAMYCRYANFMMLFDRVSHEYDSRYNKVKKYIVEFDSSFLSW